MTMEWASQSADVFDRPDDAFLYELQPFVFIESLVTPWQMGWAFPIQIPMEFLVRELPIDLLIESFSTVAPLRGRHEWHARGAYRIFNAPEYRFYMGTVSAPPTEATTPFATSATLPSTPPDLFGNDSHLIGVSYFNGALDSGFLPIGPKGERLHRLEIAAGVQIQAPPDGPQDVRLDVRSGGVVRVIGLSVQQGVLRPDSWAITYTVDGSTPGTPPAVSPTVAVSMPALSSIAAPRILAYDLPAQANGVTVKVRLQTRRLDGATNYYSEGSTVLTATASTTGASSPIGGDTWGGRADAAG